MSARGGSQGALALVLAVLLGLGIPSTGRAAATACPNEALRVRQDSTALPDCRAWEMVSPPDKNGGDIALQDVQVSSDGESLTYASGMSFAGGQSAPVMSQYLSARGADGWSVQPISPPQGSVPFAPNTGSGMFRGFNPDLTKGIVGNQDLPLAPGASTEALDLYADHLATGTYTLITPKAPSGLLTLNYRPFFAEATPDFSHILYEATEAMTPDASPFVPNAYDFTDGETRLVGILPDQECEDLGRSPGCTAPQGTEIGAGASSFSRAGNSQEETWHTISPDGSRIVFTAPIAPESPEGGQIYLRIDDTTTLHVNESEATAPEPTALPARFVAASADTTKIFFVTAAKLLDEDTNDDADLYMYDLAAPAGSHLTLISRDEATAGTSNVGGVLGASEDGSYVYFAAEGALLPSSKPLQPEMFYVYLWHDGVLTEVGQANSALDYAGRAGGRFRLATVSPDGRRLAYSITSLAHNGKRAAELMLYDADTGGDVCVTCDTVPGVTPVDTFSYLLPTEDNFFENLFAHPLSFTGDDASFFFATSAALVPRDANRQLDVYEWRDGQPHLISSGRGSTESLFLGTDAAGKNVYFTTGEELVDTDVDQNVDMYDARREGGIPAQNPPPAGVACAGESCRPSGSGTPVEATPANAVAPSPQSNTAPKRKPPKKKTKKANGHHKNKHGKKHAKKKAKKSRGAHGHQQSRPGRRNG